MCPAPAALPPAVFASAAVDVARNHFRCGINETLIRDIAKSMVTSGLAAAGYQYINLDDCWGIPQRDSRNRTQADPAKFPSGIPALATYIHSLGLKFGLYSDAGTATCTGRNPGSLHYEAIDATTFAEWGVDYLKYDDCAATGLPYFPRYTAMRDALNATGRPIFYSICAARFNRWQPMWSRPIGNTWRTTTDIANSWSSVMFNLDGNSPWWQWAGPGGFNDADMLRVAQDVLTRDEEISHFSLWAVIKSPLILGNDLRNMTTAQLSVLGNREVIALNQDTLGHQARCTLNDTVNSVQVWTLALENGDIAAVLLNRASVNRTVRATWSVLGIVPDMAPMTVRDLWEHRDMGVFNASYEVELRPHASVTIRVMATDPCCGVSEEVEGREEDWGWQRGMVS